MSHTNIVFAKYSKECFPLKESPKCSGFDLKFCFNINISRNQRTNVVFRSTVEEGGPEGASHDKESLSI